MNVSRGTLLAVVMLAWLSGLGAGPAAGTTQRALPERGTYLAVDEAGGLVPQRDAAWGAGEALGRMTPASSTGSIPYVIDLAPGERVRVLTVAQSRALHASGGPVMTLARLMICESNGDVDAVGAAGERGAWQILERYWSPVPASLPEQAAQAASIVRTHGDSPWATRGGCDAWRSQ